MEPAEHSALRGVADDTSHRLPELEQLLAAILLARNDYAGADAHLHAFLKLNPPAEQKAFVERQIAELENTGVRPGETKLSPGPSAPTGTDKSAAHPAKTPAQSSHGESQIEETAEP